MKSRIVTFILIFSLISVFALCLAEADAAAYSTGDPMPDFAVTTISGERFVISEVLKTKKAVLVNFWATWCGPCVSEFPLMEEAYRLYKDDVEIIALSTEESDTADVMREFAQDMELSFPIASDTESGLGRYFADNGIPTSVLIDRFGNIVLIEIGAQSRLDAFSNAFDILISDAYTQSVTMRTFPTSKSEIAAADDALLIAAAGNPPFRVTSSDSPLAWPFLPAQHEGASCLAASNIGRLSTYSEVIAEIDARAGDVFAFDAEYHTEEFYERLVVSVNGKKLRSFSGKADWFTYAVALDEGKNTVSLRYDKSIEYFTDAPDAREHVYLGSFRLLKGEEGAQALAQNPAFSFAAETALTVSGPGVREVRFTSSEGGDVLASLYGTNTRGYIVNDIAVNCTASVSDAYDPDEVFITENTTGTLFTSYMFQNRTLVIPVNTAQDTGLSSTLILMYNTLDSRIANLVIFADEENADEFVRRIQNRGIEAYWSYTDNSSDTGSDTLPESVTYTVTFTDQNGAPVPGCIINFCTDEMCVPVKADENGVAVFTGAPFMYHLQVIRVPGGYSFDTAQEFTSPLLGGELFFTVKKG
ncbi:MAG: redoxin family protein [Clostridia bacterium]|nr:redoxin family protein [Clostridia bacterium]